jgi:hypothetical protein
MCRSHSAPSTRDWQKHVRLLRDEIMLLLRRKHEIAVSLALGGKSCENPATYPKVRRTHMGTLLGAFEAECNASEVLDSQPVSTYSRVKRQIRSLCCGYAAMSEQRSAISKS